MKKRVLIIVLLLALSLLFTGCFSSYTPAGEGITGNGNTGGDDESAPFTVRLECNGETYIPTEDISVQWFSGDSLVTAPLTNGVASAYGLDGKYQVTLTGVPAGFTYNPNEYTATNRNKDVTIKLLPLITLMGDGSDWYRDAFQLVRTGAYGVTFTEAGQSVYFQFRPEQRGSYVLESIMDTIANEVNPRLEDYGQNYAYTPNTPYEVCRDGGASAAYTRNFKFEVGVDGDCLNFTIRCDSRVGYPVNVYFTVDYGSDYSRIPVYDMVIPTQLYDNDHNVKKSPEPSGSYVKCGREEGNSSHVLDASKFDVGIGGYYQLKGENGQLTNTVLYADLSVFIGGSNRPGIGGDQYVPTDLNIAKGDYTFFIKGWNGLKLKYGTESNIPSKYEPYKNMGGYIDATVKNNMCAVTPELKDFLLLYCRDKHIFFDGMGSGEHEGYNSSDSDQWLYFCGYYI